MVADVIRLSGRLSAKGLQGRVSFVLGAIVDDRS